MIVVRDVMDLKFGKAREAVALARQLVELASRTGHGNEPMRVLTDLTGRFYTLVLESSFASLAEYEQRMHTVFSNAEWRMWYDRLVPLVESGRREVFTLVQ